MLFVLVNLIVMNNERIFNIYSNHTFFRIYIELKHKNISIDSYYIIINSIFVKAVYLMYVY